MSFLKNIFKRKPGGTAVGNMIRGLSKSVANAVAPGAGALVGNGALMISDQDADKRDLSDAEYLKKYGVQKDGRPVTVVPQLLQQVGAVAATGLSGLAATGQGPLQYTTTDAQSNFETGATNALQGLKKYIGFIIGGAAALILLIVLLLKKKR